LLGKKRKNDTPSNQLSKKPRITFETFTLVLNAESTRDAEVEVSQNHEEPTILGRNSVPLAEGCVSRIAAKIYVQQSKGNITALSANPLRVYSSSTQTYKILKKGESAWVLPGDAIELAYNIQQQKGFSRLTLEVTKNGTEETNPSDKKSNGMEYKKGEMTPMKTEKSEINQNEPTTVQPNLNPNLDTLVKWLESIDPVLVEYASIIDKEGFNVDTVVSLNENDLREMGFKMAHRKLLVSSIANKNPLTKSNKETLRGTNEMVDTNQNTTGENKKSNDGSGPVKTEVKEEKKNSIGKRGREKRRDQNHKT